MVVVVVVVSIIIIFLNIIYDAIIDCAYMQLFHFVSTEAQ